MARDYENIIDYVQTEVDDFTAREVCCVDSLVFSCLAYLRLPTEAHAAGDEEGLCLKDLFRLEWLDGMCAGLFDPQSSAELLAAAAASPRFRDVRVGGYVAHTDEQAEQQFSAMTFSLLPHETFVAFRGTDNTLVGWKEDFNMAFQRAIPSQMAATRYLEHVATRSAGRIWCGGHSKGGNLAVYAGMTCSNEVAARLVRLFSHDGPGFVGEVMAQGRWAESAMLVDKTIPQSSVVGMLFECQEPNYRVVRSHSVGFSQHDPFSWEVDGRDFVTEGRVGLGASLLDSSVNTWLVTTSPEERERFVDAVFSVLSASGMATIGGIKRGWRTAVPKMLVATATLPEEDRKLVIDAAMDIVRLMAPPL
ncbi:MAG: DUF2974 domain-containing protein [Atopobiaceae bacterium]|nr:DUF2974 domain-containing protein [Atopobiaceae bacterium]